jgi:hypothetical protein
MRSGMGVWNPGSETLASLDTLSGSRCYGGRISGYFNASAEAGKWRVDRHTRRVIADEKKHPIPPIIKRKSELQGEETVIYGAGDSRT